MQVNVLAVRKNKTGMAVAHCQVGQMYGDVLCVPGVVAPGVYELKTYLHIKDGRIQPRIRVELK